MDIIIFSEGLQKRMKDIEATGTDDLVAMGKALNTMREILTELKRVTVTYKFSDEQQEILFFKEVKPVLLSQYYYYRKKFEVLLFDSFRDRKSRIDNYYKVLQKLQHYAYKNQSFYEYCMSGATYLDSQYFTRNGSQYLPVEKDEKFSTRYDVKLARILAHEMIKDYILTSLRKSENSKADASYNPLQWTTQKVALVELIYALHAAGVFNYGKTDIKQMVDCFEEVFSIDLGNYARIFSEIRIRKSGQTNFIDLMKNRLLEAIERMS